MRMILDHLTIPWRSPLAGHTALFPRTEHLRILRRPGWGGGSSASKMNDLPSRMAMPLGDVRFQLLVSFKPPPLLAGYPHYYHYFRTNPQQTRILAHWDIEDINGHQWTSMDINEHHHVSCPTSLWALWSAGTLRKFLPFCGSTSFLSFRHLGTSKRNPCDPQGLLENVILAWQTANDILEILLSSTILVISGLESKPHLLRSHIADQKTCPLKARYHCSTTIHTSEGNWFRQSEPSFAFGLQLLMPKSGWFHTKNI